MFSDEVVITGMGVVSPLGSSMPECLEKVRRNIDDSRSCGDAVIRLPEEIENHLISKRERRRHNRLSLMVIEAINRCLVDAGINADSVAGFDTGIVTASFFGCLNATDGTFQSMRANERRNSVNPIEFAKATHSFPASMAMTQFGMKGPVAALVSSLSVGLDAIHLAKTLIGAGKAKRVFVVAYEEIPALAEQYLMGTGGLEDVEDMSLFSPVCEGCIALLVESGSSQLSGAINYPKASLGAIKSRLAHGGTVTKCIRENILDLGGRSNGRRVSLFVKQSSRSVEERRAEEAAISGLNGKDVLKNAISLKPFAGDYLGAAGPMELGLVISSISDGQPDFVPADEGGESEQGIDVLINGFDFRGNVTTAAVNAFRKGNIS